MGPSVVVRGRRVPHDVRANELLGELEEPAVYRLVHVDSLDRAAALPCVVDRAVDDVLDRLREVAVGRDVRRVVAAELEARMQKAPGRRLDHPVPAEHAPGEDHLVDAIVGDHSLALRVVAVERLHQVSRGPGLGERAREVIAAQGRARAVLDDDRVAREHRRDDAVDRGQEGVVPRRQVEHDPDRLPDDAALEAREGQDDVCKRGLGDRHHVARARRRRLDLAARLRDRLAHHAGDVGRDGLQACLHREDGALAEGDAVGEGARAPRARRIAGAVERRAGAPRVCELDLASGLSGERVVDDEGLRACGHGREDSAPDWPRARGGTRRPIAACVDRRVDRRAASRPMR